MKIKTIHLLMIFLSLSVNLFGAKATITFSTRQDITVNIFAPIDENERNYTIPTDKLDLKPNISIKYDLDVSDFCIIKLQYSHGRRYKIFITEGDEAGAEFTGDGIKFTGTNSAGNIYLNDEIDSKFGFYCWQIDSIFEHNSQNIIDFPKIEKSIDEEFFLRFQREIDSMKRLNIITDKFADIIGKDIRYGINAEIINNYNRILSGKKIKPSDKDIIKINNLLDSIYDKYPASSDIDILKMSYGDSYVSGYYRYKFDKLAPIEKEALVGKYDSLTFGPYTKYLLAPDYIRYPTFGNAFILQFLFDANEFDKDKMLKYLEENCPDNNYIPIIKKKMREQDKANKQENADGTAVNYAPTLKYDSVIVISDKINVLKELSRHKDLANKYLYIDVWATWCAPCKIEFAFKGDLDELLAQYGQIVPVYISIDEDKLEPVWRKSIDSYSLYGYHIRASKELHADIANTYGGGALTIPRYILLGPDGTVINGNLPRPSALSKLKDFFDQIVN